MAASTGNESNIRKFWGAVALALLLLVAVAIALIGQSKILRMYRSGGSWLMLIVAYLVCAVLLAFLTLYDYENAISRHCLCRVEDRGLQALIERGRGENYTLDHMKKAKDILMMSSTTNKNAGLGHQQTGCCLTTAWSGLHYLQYAILGFLLPRLWPVLIVIGVAFEWLEYSTWKCHDILDILYNTAGVATGVGIRYFFDPPQSKLQIKADKLADKGGAGEWLISSI